MHSFISGLVPVLILSLLSFALAQDGYIGYELHKRGDPESTIYETESTTDPTELLPSEPDVFLNASVYVGEIDIEVDNITAKINLDAKVLNLLHFSAGVDASIDRVKLTIQNVTAKVLLEARLENVVTMVGDVLDSLDLNPIIATLGQDLGQIVTNVTTTLSNGSALATKRSLDSLEYNMANNILYSVNDYSGQTHTNRILGQNGSLYDVYLNNDGHETGRKVVGWYKRDMSFTGHNRTITIDGQTEYELGYRYAPYPGLRVTSNIYVDTKGMVVKAQVIAEAEGGGTSTVSDDDL